MKQTPPLITLLLALTGISAFQTPPSPVLRLTPTSPRGSLTLLEMSDGKKRRRKRKVDSSTAPSTAATEDSSTSSPPQTTTTITTAQTQGKESAKALAALMLAQEKMMYDQEDEEDLTAFTPEPLSSDRIAAAASRAGYTLESPQAGNAGGGGEPSLNDLFDSREFLAKKREKQLAEKEGGADASSTVVPTRKKIKRSDIEAYTRLLEMDPLADEDSRYFEDDNEVDFISALLGDVEPGVGNAADDEENRTGKKVVKKTSFLGIGSGPLQVGHFIGALGVVLMAFIDYPGFPLTNLPDPLRGALQGGLGAIYLINTVLAVFAAMSAPSRRQPSILWAAKTFAVGGIAYDQLMQIPTPEEMAERARREEDAIGARVRGRRGKKQ
eukprot:CCRYP_017916-RA/>CCRYP_017916-RA protein AED:0.03 eAED:0.03 QI:256/1/1/1/0.5/0.33/3/1756/382